MRRAPAAMSTTLPTAEYYERIGRLQQELRDSEKKRLDLEKELNEYNQSDMYRIKLKYVKLKKYLKEICESEKRAHIRNQEYLKQFERVQAHFGHFTTNTEKLQELKTEYETQIKKIQLLSKDSLGIKGELKEGREKVAVPAEMNSRMSMSRGLYQPATIFMGRQMSTLSSIGNFSTEQESAQPTKNFSILNPHLHQQTAPSSRVTDSCVVQTPSNTQCLTKSDKVDDKTSLQIGEKTPVTARAPSEEEQTHCLEIGSSPRHGESNLSDGRKSVELCSSPQQRLNPKNRTSDLKCDSYSRSEGSEEGRLTLEHIEVEEESASLPIPALSVSKHCASENERSPETCSTGAASPGHLTPGDPESYRPLEHMQEEQEEGSASSSSSLTVSISEDDFVLESSEPHPNVGTQMEGEAGRQPFTLIHTEQEREVFATRKNDGVLQALNSLDSKEASCTNSPRQSEKASDLGFLHGQPATSLKEHDQPLHQEVDGSALYSVQSVDKGSKVAAALSKGLTAACEASSTIHSDESSCSVPSIPQKGTRIKDTKPAFRLSSLRIRDQEEDESEQESVSAKVPVTETKAYQLLKTSTLQEHPNQMGDRCQGTHATAAQLSGLNTRSSALQMKAIHEVASEASFSSCKGSPLSRHEDKKKFMTHLKSSAFWGESDDSNSEIEAALRPRNQDADSDDFDDFYS